MQPFVTDEFSINYFESCLDSATSGFSAFIEKNFFENKFWHELKDYLDKNASFKNGTNRYFFNYNKRSYKLIWNAFSIEIFLEDKNSSYPELNISFWM